MRVLVDLALMAGLFLLLALAIVNVPLEPTGLTLAAQQELGNSGVDNPVTAVLLNYRSYDTLLELAVLLLALLGSWSLGGVAPRSEPQRSVTGRSASLDSLVRLLVPAMVVAAGYILWIGAYASGGAFQAGAVLAAALVLMHLAQLPQAQALAGQRLLLAMGLAVFLVAALLSIALGGNLLQYPDGEDKTFILAIEAAATVSIALTLAALFTGLPPARGDALQP